MIGLFRSLSISPPPPPRERRAAAPDEARARAVLAAFLANLERLCLERRRQTSGEGMR